MRWSTPLRKRFAVGLGALFLVCHAVVGPLLLPARALTMWQYERKLVKAQESAFGLLDQPLQELVLVNAPDFYFAEMLFLTRVARGKPPAEFEICLNGTLEPIVLSRLDVNTVELAPEGGFMAAPFNRIYRDPTRPMPRSTIYSFDTFQIRPLEINAAGEPMRAKFRFRWPLNHRRMVWAAWHNGRYERLKLPDVGQSMRLESKGP